MPGRDFLPRRTDLREMFRLAVPVVVVQVGLMMMGVVDTIMVGHLDHRALAAAAIGNVYVFGAIVWGMGLLMVLDPIVSQGVGAGDQAAIARGVQRGVVLAVFLTLPLTLINLPGEWLLTRLHQQPEVVPLAAQFTRATLWGMFPFLLFIVFRQTLQAMEKMAAIVWTIIIANGVNLFLNWVLIYGKFGLPAMGAVGSGLATGISRFFLAGGILLFAWKDLKPALIPWRREAFDLAPLLRMLGVGFPIAVTIALEYGAFAIVGLMMGTLGTTQMAAHQIALNLASLTFMVPLGVSGAGAVLVGQAIGRGDPGGMRRAAGSALILGVGFMVTTAILFEVMPAAFARIYSAEAEVVVLAAALIPLAGLFQVFDGTQAVAVGVLRGAGDTRWPMVINVLGFWLVGVPISWWLGFRTPYGPVGLWWGFVAGLVAVAALLLWRVRNRFRSTIERLIIDKERSEEQPVFIDESVPHA
jgi:MATE family multidrug resistance protein